MFCEKCGKELLEGDVFCTGCGTPVKGVTTDNEVDSKAVEEVLKQDVKEEYTQVEGDKKTVSSESVNHVNPSTLNGAWAPERNPSSTDKGSNVLRGDASSKFNYNRESNGVASAFRIIGWLVIAIGGCIGLVIIYYAISKSGSSSSSYYSATSMFSGMGVGFGIGTIIVGAISGLGFLGFAEIIQLLQDQKTIMLRKEINKK